jgi:hypothetical protein
MTNVTANDQKSNVPALPSTANISSYLDEHCGGGSGVLFKFAKDQRFRRIDDGEEIPLGTEFTVIYDQIQVGWTRFYGKGMPPERKMGPLFEGFSPPPRDTLGETDPVSVGEGAQRSASRPVATASPPAAAGSGWRTLHLRHHLDHRAARCRPGN